MKTEAATIQIDRSPQAACAGFGMLHAAISRRAQSR
jgi:hypothetical protein